MKNRYTASMQKPITVVFYGISGAGKGTQAEILTKYLELEASEQSSALYIETGEHFRGFVRAQGYTNERTAEVMARGELLPAFLPVYLWASTLIEQFNGTQSLVLDGLARRESEVPILDSALKFYGRDDYHVIVLDVDDDLAKERLENRGRSDDKLDEDAIATKLAWYHDNVEPCISLYRNMGRPVHHVDGAKSIEDIHKEILEILKLT